MVSYLFNVEICKYLKHLSHVEYLIASACVFVCLCIRAKVIIIIRNGPGGIKIAVHQA